MYIFNEITSIYRSRSLTSFFSCSLLWLIEVSIFISSFIDDSLIFINWVSLPASNSSFNDSQVFDFDTINAATVVDTMPDKKRNRPALNIGP